MIEAREVNVGIASTVRVDWYSRWSHSYEVVDEVGVVAQAALPGHFVPCVELFLSALCMHRLSEFMVGKVVDGVDFSGTSGERQESAGERFDGDSDQVGTSAAASCDEMFEFVTDILRAIGAQSPFA